MTATLHVVPQDETDAAATPETAFLSVKALNKNYGDARVVQNLDLELPEGELLGLLGPSGCGKTTTLRMIAGLIAVSSGRIVVGRKDVTDLPAYKRDMGMVFQSYALFPHMTVAQNVAFGLEMRGLPRIDIEKKVARAISMVHLAGKEERRPRELSGGQQQRVALARALVIEPSILLLDEPLSNLDAKLRDTMRQEIRDLQKRIGITAVFVTHDQAEALSMCDKVAVMHNGRLEQIGSPQELYEKPRTAFVASFVGRVNDLRGRFRAGRIIVNGSALACRAPATAIAEGQEVQILIRPHRIAIVRSEQNKTTPAPSGNLNSAVGTVLRFAYVGEVIQYEVDALGTTVIVEENNSGSRPILQPSTSVGLAWTANDTMVHEVGP